MTTPLQNAREKAGLTQAQLAELVETKQSVISRIESRRMNAGTDLAARLAKQLGISELEVLYPERYIAAPTSAKKRRAA